jgi:hypothetical protein
MNRWILFGVAVSSVAGLMSARSTQAPKRFFYRDLQRCVGNDLSQPHLLDCGCHMDLARSRLPVATTDVCQRYATTMTSLDDMGELGRSQPLPRVAADVSVQSAMMLGLVMRCESGGDPRHGRCDCLGDTLMAHPPDRPVTTTHEVMAWADSLPLDPCP